MSKDIHALVVQNYQNNILYLEKSHKKLYEKLVAFESAIDKGELRERYELSYEAGGFDISDKETSSYFYMQQSDKIMQMIKQSITHKKNENVFETFKNIVNPPQGYKNILDFYQTHNDKNFSMKQIEKFIFFGAGLFIVPVDTKINSKHYFIIEDSLELFRLSLFTVPYYSIAKKAILTFAVASDIQEFKTTAQKFLDQEFYCNHYIKFFEAPHHSEEKLNVFHTLVMSQSHLNFFYSSMLEQYTRSLGYLKHHYNFLNLLDTQLHSYFQTKPTVLVAPGPSLEKNIEWLQANQENLIIVALSATLPTLYKAGIKPNIITHFDGFKRSLVHYEKVPNLSFFQDALLLFSTKTPQEIVNLFDKERIFFYESATNFKKDFGSVSAFCAGSSTFLILIALQVKELYLLGLDLAVDQKTLQTHTKEYQSQQTEPQKDMQTDFRSTLIEHKGNFQNIVKTTPNFSLSIDAVNAIATGLKTEKQQVYNLNDGAYFESTIPTQTSTVKLTKLAKNGLYALFQNSSQNSITPYEQANIIKSLEHTQQIKIKLQKYAKKTIAGQTQLLEELVKIENILCYCQDNSCDILSSIIQNYVKFLYPYIFDLCNTQEININDNVEYLYTDILKNLQEITMKLQKSLKE